MKKKEKRMIRINTHFLPFCSEACSGFFSSAADFNFRGAEIFLSGAEKMPKVLENIHAHPKIICFPQFFSALEA